MSRVLRNTEFSEFYEFRSYDSPRPGEHIFCLNELNLIFSFYYLQASAQCDLFRIQLSSKSALAILIIFSSLGIAWMVVPGSLPCSCHFSNVILHTFPFPLIRPDGRNTSFLITCIPSVPGGKSQFELYPLSSLSTTELSANTSSAPEMQQNPHALAMYAYKLLVW